MIGASVTKVDDGCKLVEQASSTMAEIVASVRCVADIMGEIQSASQDQSAGIDRINQDIGRMDQATHQNTALVEQAAAAAQAMEQQAEDWFSAWAFSGSPMTRPIRASRPWPT